MAPGVRWIVQRSTWPGAAATHSRSAPSRSRQTQTTSASGGASTASSNVAPSRTGAPTLHPLARLRCHADSLPALERRDLLPDHLDLRPEPVFDATKLSREIPHRVADTQREVADEHQERKHAAGPDPLHPAPDRRRHVSTICTPSNEKTCESGSRDTESRRVFTGAASQAGCTLTTSQGRRS